MSLEDIPSDASTYFSIYKIDVDKVAEVLFEVVSLSFCKNGS